MLRPAHRLVLFCACSVGCASGWKELPHDARFQRAPQPELHRRPEGESLSGDWWDRALSSTVLPAGHLVSPGRWAEAGAAESRSAKATRRRIDIEAQVVVNDD